MVSNVAALEQDGWSADQIAPWRAAVDRAWEAARAEIPCFVGTIMTFWLASGSQPGSVTVAIGIGAAYGRVEAASPEDMERELRRHLNSRYNKPLMLELFNRSACSSHHGKEAHTEIAGRCVDCGKALVPVQDPNNPFDWEAH